MGQIILRVLSWACAEHIHSKKIAIFVTLVQDKGNEGSGNDMKKKLRLISVLRPIRYFLATSVKPREKWVWKVTTLLYRCYGNRLATLANAIPPKYINIIYEFCLARQRHDVWIAAVPESCSTTGLVELLSLPNLIQIPEFSSARLRHDVWTGPKNGFRKLQCIYIAINSEINHCQDHFGMM